MDPATVTLDDALRLLTLPRVVGTATDGEQITAQNGPYGPYLKKGRDSRSIGSEEQLFTITLAEAEAIYAQPKTRGSRAASALRQLGTDESTGREVSVKQGRFGPYVTDGEYNATLKKTDAIELMTLEQAVEMLAEKRAAGPAKKKPATRRTTAGKTAASKTATGKTAAKKTPAKPATRRAAATKKAST
jgi:DNA topoisomerase-1